MRKNHLGICLGILCEVWSGTFGSCGYLEKAEQQEGLCNHFIAAVIVGNGAKVSIDIKEKAQFQIVWEIPSMKRYWPFRISLLYSLRQT